jgi:formate C-acetyltransferase
MSICAEALIHFAERRGKARTGTFENVRIANRNWSARESARKCRHARNFGKRCVLWFVHLGVTTELNTWDAFCPGHLDQHLYPFYQRELAAGR